MERSSEGSLLKSISGGKSGKRRCVERLRKRWIEEVEEDVRELEVSCRRRQAQGNKVGIVPKTANKPVSECVTKDNLSQ